MIVCLCKVVSDREIRAAIGEGHHTVKALARRCGAGTGQNCGGCHPALQQLLQCHAPRNGCHAAKQPANASDEPLSPLSPLASVASIG